HVMGRETFLAPVRWDEGAWPVVNNDGTLQTDMKCQTLPLVPMPQEPILDDFNGDKLALYWSYLNIPDSTNYSLTERKGYLRLRPSTVTIDEKSNPTFIGRRQTERNFTATTLIDVSKMGRNSQTGLTAYAARLNHYDVIIDSDAKGAKQIQAVIRIGQSRNVIASVPLKQDKIYLSIDSDAAFYNLSYSTDGKNFKPLGKMEYRYLTTETIGGFCGVHLGLYTQSIKPSGYVDIDWFKYEAEN
ncbi:MAG: glycoside hydrolase family 43 protein, partial [Prevotella sp.]|nr:glycoside hydrolase family 43 protein [Prevotella sp.]